MSASAVTRRLLAVCAALVVGALGLGAAAAAAPTGRSAAGFPPDRPTRVLVLGDSVMLGAAPQDVAALPGREVVVDAAVNRSTKQGADKVAELGSDWDVVVVLLGHNDGGYPTIYQPAARQILDQLKDVPSVVWLTIHEARPYYADVNAFLETLPEAYPNVTIADWNALAAEHPDAMSGDGLHLKPQGALLMSGLVAEQVEAAERAAAPTTTTTTTTAPPTTTSTTEVPETTTTAPSIAVSAEGPDTAGDEGAPATTEDSGTNVPLIALGAVAVAVVAMVVGLLVFRSRRKETQRDADLAG